LEIQIYSKTLVDLMPRKRKNRGLLIENEAIKTVRILF
jgi:hypothetical protein